MTDFADLRKEMHNEITTINQEIALASVFEDIQYLKGQIEGLRTAINLTYIYE